MNLKLSDEQILQVEYDRDEEYDGNEDAWIEQAFRALADAASKHTAKQIVEWLERYGRVGGDFATRLVSKLKSQGLWDA